MVTVFTRSRSVRPALENTFGSVDAVSELREREAVHSLLPLGAARIGLGRKDAEKPYRAPRPAQVAQIASELAEVLDGMEDAELIAPAAVTRHPDHLAVREAARCLGCRWFWEDVAFWPTYAFSGCDRHGVRKAAGEVRYLWNGVWCRAVPQDRVDKVLTGILKEAQPELVVTSQEGAADIAAITRRSCTVAGWLHSVSASGMGVLEADFTSRSPRRSSSPGG